jgi:hypothetical protein
MPHPPSYHALFVLPTSLRVLQAISGSATTSPRPSFRRPRALVSRCTGPGADGCRRRHLRWLATVASLRTVMVSGWARMPNGPVMAGWIRLLHRPLNAGQPYSVKALERIPGSATILAVGSRLPATGSAGPFPTIVSYGALP